MVDALDIEFLRNLKVLYVEDSDDVRAQLGLFLKRRTGFLIVAANGREGLDAFQSEQPHIVITDIMMPVMDGLDMAKEIRTLDQSVPIIVTTAFEQTDYLLRSIEIGVDKYVVKPVDTERLNQAMLVCAHRLRGEDQLRRQRKLDAELMRTRHVEAMGILASGLAHDYNNLLQVITGYVSLAKINAEPGGKIYEYLAVAEKSAAQANELGQRLRHLAKRSEANYRIGQLGIVIVESINSVLTENRDDKIIYQAGKPDTYKSEIPTDIRIKVEYDWPQNLPPVKFDESQMRKVFTSLAQNALEAMAFEGTIKVIARQRLLNENDNLPLPDGEYLQISLVDSGRGIEPEHIPLVFEPYFSTKDSYNQKGLGLSLALCQTIINRYGGMISVESVSGTGAVFTILLPVAEVNLQ
jgi:signal transduction histidine kinase